MEVLYDTGIHLVLEALGALVLAYVYRFCSHWHHRILGWLVIGVPLSYATVRLVG